MKWTNWAITANIVILTVYMLFTGWRIDNLTTRVRELEEGVIATQVRINTTQQFAIDHVKLTREMLRDRNKQ